MFLMLAYKRGANREANLLIENKRHSLYIEKSRLRKIIKPIMRAKYNTIASLKNGCNKKAPIYHNNP